MTVAAISRQLKTLEHDFDVRLFHRSSGKLHLAGIVEAGLQDLRAGFERLALGVKKMREFGTHRPLTVAVEPSFAATWLLRRLPDFNALYPDISVRLDASLRVVNLAHERDIDLAIRYGNGDYPAHCVNKLLEDETFPVCSPKLLSGVHPLTTPEDLRWHTLLHDDFETADSAMPNWRDCLQAAGYEIDASVGPHFPLTSMVVDAAALGQGVALASRVIAAGHLATGALVRPFGADFTTRAEFAYYFVCLEKVADTHDVRAFREWIVGQAKLEQLPGVN